MNHCERDSVAEGLLWLARGLDFVPEDESELRFSFRRLLSGWSNNLHRLKQHLPIACNNVADLSANAKMLAARRDDDPEVFLWDARTGKLQGKVNAPEEMVLFSPDAKVLLAAGDEIMRFWNVATQESIGAVIRADRAFSSIQFSRDGKRLLRVDSPNPDGSAVRVWEVPTGKAVGKPLPLPLSVAIEAAFSPDGSTVSLLIAGGTQVKRTYEVRIWEPATGKTRTSPIKLTYMVTSAAFSSDGKQFATTGILQHKNGSADYYFQVFDTATGNPLSSQMAVLDPMDLVAFGPDGRTLLLRDTVGFNLFRFSPSPGVENRDKAIQRIGTRVPVEDPEQKGFTFVFNPNGKSVLLRTSPDKASLWDTATGATIGSPLDRVERATFEDDEATLVTTDSQNVRRWQVAQPLTGRSVVGVFDPSLPAAFSPDSTNFADGIHIKDRLELRFWDPVTAKSVGEAILMGTDKSGAMHRLRHVAYSPNGKVLVTIDGYMTYRMRLWDSASHKLIGILADPVDIHDDVAWANRLTFSPDSRRLLLVGGDTAQQWDTATGKLMGKPLMTDGSISVAAYSPDGAA